MVWTESCHGVYVSLSNDEGSRHAGRVAVVGNRANHCADNGRALGLLPRPTGAQRILDTGTPISPWARFPGPCR